jgi:lipopolysaccharide biosynthesis regulator YciM
MSADWITLLILLLPVAALSGWWAAKAAGNRSNAGGRQHPIHPEYFKGLNYVLNEQPDKAIEIFVKMVEVDSETVETHLALGNLFRRRGEVDRAIRIHQNLIARPALAREYRSHAMFELGMDYMRLGILDRAEGLFSELVAADMMTDQALAYLLDIYQQEQDWNKAITTARRLETVTGQRLEPVTAQFYCELAQIDLASQNEKGAKFNLKRALNLDPKCVRASLLEGQMAQKEGNYRVAIKAYRRIEKQDPEYIPEVIEPMRACFQALDKPDKFIEYLYEILESHGGITALLFITDEIAHNRGEEAAIRFISEELRIRPSVRGVDHLIKYAISKTDGELNKNLAMIKELTTRLLKERPVYKCNFCGFDAKHLYWRCPGCKRWNTVKPVHGVHGE